MSTQGAAGSYRDRFFLSTPSPPQLRTNRYCGATAGAGNNLCCSICCSWSHLLSGPAGVYRTQRKLPMNFGKHARKGGSGAQHHLEILEQLKPFLHQVTCCCECKAKAVPKDGARGRNKHQAIFYPTVILQPPQKHSVVFHESQRLRS